MNIEAGECIMTRIGDDQIRIDRADDQILIAKEVLDGVWNNPSNKAWVEQPEGSPVLLHLNGTNRCVVYQIGILRPVEYGIEAFEAQLV